MRDQKDKKGGGLMILHEKEQKWIDMQKVSSMQNDTLIMRGKMQNKKVTIILVYFSVVRNEVEKSINQNILKEIRKTLSKCEEDEMIFILGDFNAHIGILGDQ